MKAEFYRDFSGCTASIRKWGKQFWLRIKSPNGTMTGTIRTISRRKSMTNPYSA